MQTPLHIVVPVYNEAENFPALRSALEAIRSPFEAYVIYDFDEDNTIPVVERAIQRATAISSRQEHGPAAGWWARSRPGFDRCNRGPVLVVMGDLSDDLDKVERMLHLYHQGYHVVAPSRYMPGGELWAGRFSSEISPDGRG